MPAILGTDRDPINLDEFDAFAALPETVEAVIASPEYADWLAECAAAAEADAAAEAGRYEVVAEAPF